MKPHFNSDIFAKTATEWNIKNKAQFLEKFLFGLTIMNRAIWSDQSYSESEQLNMLKWSNELNHRVWNLLHELNRNEDRESISRLMENINFSCQNSAELNGHLGANLKNCYENMQE